MTERQTAILRQGSLFEVDSPLYGKIRGERSVMDFPFFALSKSACMTPLNYEHDNVRIEIRPGATGIATMYDKEIILYVASLMAQQLHRGDEVGQDFTFKAHDFFRATGKIRPSKKEYQRFAEALERLQGTQIRTNIRTGNQQDKGWFSWLAEAHANYETMPNGDEKLRVIKVRLCAWLHRAILRDGRIYDYHPDYFKIKPNEKRLYEIAHCHCDGEEFEIPIDALSAKVGTGGEPAEFKRALKNIGRDDKIPDYHIALKETIPNDPRLDTKGRRIMKPDTVVVMTPKSSRKSAVHGHVAQLALSAA